MTAERRCVDCIAEGVGTARPIHRDAGPRRPRCTTHHRAAKKRSQSLAHARRIENGYGITAEAYWRLYAAQGGRCAVCQRANGKSKRLAVDHDHVTGRVRGLLCTTCNVIIIGRYTVEALQRAIDYRSKPPADAVLTKDEHQHQIHLTFDTTPVVHLCKCGTIIKEEIDGV
jgi:Recombination endonuclease VII